MAWSRGLAVLVFAALAAAPAAAQPVPRPFPEPGSSQTRPAPPLPPAPPRPEGTPPEASPQEAAPPAATAESPTEEMLGVPILPNARFLVSYDAGRGQRFYLFGTLFGFSEVVAYYRNVLRQRGDLVFETPPVHVFEVGRFREETMAFPPGVTVKDYAWSGFGGYLDPRPGADPARYPTIIQIVPVPPGERR
jgi:hypothetical protein